MTLVPSVTELILAELLYLQYEDKNKPIYFYINSTGTSKVSRLENANVALPSRFSRARASACLFIFVSLAHDHCIPLPSSRRLLTKNKTKQKTHIVDFHTASFVFCQNFPSHRLVVQEGQKYGYDTEAFAIYDTMKYVNPAVHTVAAGSVGHPVVHFDSPAAHTPVIY